MRSQVLGAILVIVFIFTYATEASKTVTATKYKDLEDCEKECKNKYCHFCKRNRLNEFHCFCLDKPYKKVPPKQIETDCEKNQACEKCAKVTEHDHVDCLQSIKHYVKEEQPKKFKSVRDCQSTCNKGKGYCHLCTNRTDDTYCFCWNEYLDLDSNLYRNETTEIEVVAESFRGCLRSPPCSRCVECKKDSMNETYQCTCLEKFNTIHELVKEEFRLATCDASNCKNQCQFCDAVMTKSCFCWEKNFLESQGHQQVPYLANVCNAATCDKCIDCVSVIENELPMFSCTCLVEYIEPQRIPDDYYRPPEEPLKAPLPVTTSKKRPPPPKVKTPKPTPPAHQTASHQFSLSDYLLLLCFENVYLFFHY